MKIYKLADALEPTEIEKPFVKPKWKSIWENAKMLVDGKPITGKPSWAEPEEPQMEEAERAYQLAVNDHQFNQLYNKIKHKTKDYGYTSQKNSFSFHAPYHETMDLLKEQGWTSGKSVFNRKGFTHPQSKINIMSAEGDAFVVFVPKQEEFLDKPIKQLNP